MLLHAAIDLVRRHLLVPRSVRIDDHRRALTADTQATDACSLAHVIAGGQTGVLDLLLEQLPRLLTHGRFAALRAQAQEDVPADMANADLCFDSFELLVWFAHAFIVSQGARAGPVP